MGDSMQTQSPYRKQLEDGLGPIRARFRAMLSDHRTCLAALCVEAEAEATASEPALRGIAERAHRIAGVAPTLGFDRIGESAAALDALISRGLTQRQAPAALWEQARPVLEQLLRALADAV